ncbi:MAG: 30S ribosomal protein S1 [Proteobacteria bacterium]|nr:30S ribosomal protein S1 [Pseudomonadota bacterium]
MPSHKNDNSTPYDSGSNYTEDGLTFAQMFEQSLQQNTVNEGQVVTGKVVSIGAETVLIDVGYKCEGEVPIGEFKDHQGNVTAQVGDELPVLIESFESEKGTLRLSKLKAEMSLAWEEIAQACERGDVLEGTVVEVVRGGLTVDIGVRAFLPASQIDTRPIKNLDQFLGQNLKFKVVKFNKKRGNIVLSRKSVMEEEREQLKSSTLKQIKVGAIVRGLVKNITDYGAFVDLGGIDGLLHITDASWGRVKNLADLLKIGQEINVRVLKYDQEKERVSLGLKQTQPDPWQDMETRYIVGQRIKGRVVSITDYGAFVEIEPGIEGLIHVSEMSWSQKVKDPRKLLNADQDVESVILDIDPEGRRLSLGLKQITPNPWDTLEYKYPTASRIKGKIKNVTDFGIFVEIEEGIDGLVHISDLSWDEKVSNPNELYKKGDEVEAVVQHIDKDNERISLSIKLLSGDPWADYIHEHRSGTQVEGVVTKLANFGVFVELAKGIEGMIHISELSDERVLHPDTVTKVGERIKCEIIAIDPKERKISLSVKAMKRREEKEAMESYSSSAAPRSSIADTLDPEVAARLGLIKNKTPGEA